MKTEIDPLVAAKLDAISSLDRALTAHEDEAASYIPHVVGFGANGPEALGNDINLWLDTHLGWKVISINYQPVAQPDSTYYTALVLLELIDEV